MKQVVARKRVIVLKTTGFDLTKTLISHEVLNYDFNLLKIIIEPIKKGLPDNSLELNRL